MYLGRNLQYFKNPLYTLASFLEVFFYFFAHLREGEELAKFEIFKKGEEKEKKKKSDEREKGHVVLSINW